MSRPSDPDGQPPIRLLLAVAILLLLGTIGAIILPPTTPEVTLQRAIENWPPAPAIQPPEAPFP
jgi:hypothetical protein